MNEQEKNRTTFNNTKLPQKLPSPLEAYTLKITHNDNKRSAYRYSDFSCKCRKQSNITLPMKVQPFSLFFVTSTRKLPKFTLNFLNFLLWISLHWFHLIQLWPTLYSTTIMCNWVTQTFNLIHSIPKHLPCQNTHSQKSRMCFPCNHTSDWVSFYHDEIRWYNNTLHNQ